MTDKEIQTEIQKHKAQLWYSALLKLPIPERTESDWTAILQTEDRIREIVHINYRKYHEDK